MQLSPHHELKHLGECSLVEGLGLQRWLAGFDECPARFGLVDQNRLGLLTDYVHATGRPRDVSPARRKPHLLVADEENEIFHRIGADVILGQRFRMQSNRNGLLADRIGENTINLVVQRFNRRDVLISPVVPIDRVVGRRLLLLLDEIAEGLVHRSAPHGAPTRLRIVYANETL